MKLGVYFPIPSDYPMLHALGVDYAVRPVVTPATDPSTDKGFKSSPVIRSTLDGTVELAYGADEVNDPTYGRQRLETSPPGSFVNISNGAWGRNALLIPPKFSRGLLNGASLMFPDIFSIPRAYFSWLNCSRAWGKDWTVVVYCDRPSWWIRYQLNFYRKRGVARAFLWRWDYNKYNILGAL